MTSVGSSLLWVKVLVLLGALGLFVWWQFRDLARARKQRERAAKSPNQNPRS